MSYLRFKTFAAAYFGKSCPKVKSMFYAGFSNRECREPSMELTTGKAYAFEYPSTDDQKINRIVREHPEVHDNRRQFIEYAIKEKTIELRKGGNRKVQPFFL